MFLVSLCLSGLSVFPVLPLGNLAEMVIARTHVSPYPSLSKADPTEVVTAACICCTFRRERVDHKSLTSTGYPHVSSHSIARGGRRLCPFPGGGKLSSVKQYGQYHRAGKCQS